MYAPSSNSSLQNVLKQSKVNAVNQPTSSTQGNNRGLSVQVC